MPLFFKKKCIINLWGFEKITPKNVNLIVYPLLRGDSTRAIKRKGGKPYEPNGVLLKKLSVLLGLSMTEVRNQIMKEREYLLKQ